MIRTTLATSLALLAALAGGARLSAQETADGPKKAAEWPKLEAGGADRVFALATQFKKEDEKLRTEAAAELAEIGVGAAPFLFQRVHDRPENENAAIFGVLDGLLAAEHSDLMIKELKKPSVELRAYLVRRLCRFVDPTTKKALDGMRKDKQERIAFHAALGCLALKDETALDQVVAYSKTHWADEVDLVAEVMPKARSAEFGNEVFAAIRKQKPADQMATLRIARYVAIDDHKPILRTYLDSPDHTVKKEAVNVCRVLAGEAPLEKLDVFQAIKMATEWKGKL